jgi:hypothetical protein
MSDGRLAPGALIVGEHTRLHLLGLGLLRFDRRFLEAIRFWFTPEIISALRGRFWDDWWAEGKLLWWWICCTFTVGPQIALLGSWLE